MWQKHRWRCASLLSGIWMRPFHNPTISHLCFIRLVSHSAPPPSAPIAVYSCTQRKHLMARLWLELHSAVSSKPHTAPTWNKPDPATGSQRFQNVRTPRTQFKLFITDPGALPADPASSSHIFIKSRVFIGSVEILIGQGRCEAYSLIEGILYTLKLTGHSRLVNCFCLRFRFELSVREYSHFSGQQ